MTVGSRREGINSLAHAADANARHRRRFDGDAEVERGLPGLRIGAHSRALALIPRDSRS
jgi:hypothetical protein